MIKTTNRQAPHGAQFLSSSLFHPVTSLGVVTTATVDFQAGVAFKCDTTSSSGLTLAISNASEGVQAALYIDEVNSESHTLTFPSGWKWLSDKPTSLAADKIAVLALECFDGTTVTAAYKEQAE